MSLISLARRGRLVAVFAGALLLVPALAEAKPGGSKSSGSRGSKTFQSAPTTTTAPGGAQTMQRTTAPAATPGATNPAAAQAARPGVPAAAQPSFARNLMMGVGAGLLGAGLFGLLSGSGLFGGLGSLAGFFGLLLQAALIFGVIWLAVRFFRRRSEPQLAAAGGAPLPRQGMAPEGSARSALGGLMGGGAATATTAAAPVLGEVKLSAADFGIFEQRLKALMDGYSREDEAAVRAISTPEMLGYFGDDINENHQKGVIDLTSDIKLLQGDLAEAWSENGMEYATVAMRYSYINAIKDRQSGRVVEGSETAVQEAVEHWTFVRPRGGEWVISAIQQAA
jgi:predicted lipid-binding transport protein (Tim44 family)